MPGGGSDLEALEGYERDREYEAAARREAALAKIANYRHPAASANSGDWDGLWTFLIWAGFLGAGIVLTYLLDWVGVI